MDQTWHFSPQEFRIALNQDSVMIVVALFEKLWGPYKDLREQWEIQRQIALMKLNKNCYQKV